MNNAYHLGVARNQPFITSDFIANMARCVGRGTVSTNGLLDHLWTFLGHVRCTFVEQQAYLTLINNLKDGISYLANVFRSNDCQGIQEMTK
jgi:hypothetical protein